ncbi:branched-chain amino acid ABC transporter permease [Nocardioides humi]|uniref:Branched-chain amino acid ABC transporter permease n=1 Tax=Nocardioides humi TaxID=449461 RepID=A0ABN2AEP7_9ACTN|nr:branched-chain amino acid ABC transporter permease [Nocardioides humi]
MAALGVQRRLTTRYSQERALIRSPLHVLGYALAILAVLAVPRVFGDRFLLGYYFTNDQLLGIGMAQINVGLIAVLAAMALNFLVGQTGLISTGHAAFFCVGGVVAAVCQSNWDLSFPLIVLLAGLVGALVGVLVGLPSLRLSGLYLMLATLALHFIAIFLFQKYQLEFFGPGGVIYTEVSIGPWALDSDERWFFVLAVCVVALALAIRNLMRSRHGRAFISVRDHEVAAGSMGVNVSAAKLRAFSASSFVVSAVGAVYAFYIGIITDESFTLMFVLGYFAMIILGGIGSTGGAVLGALVWTLTPYALQNLSLRVSPDTPLIGEKLVTYPSQVASLGLGLLIIVIMRYRPEGLNGFLTATRRTVRAWPYRD